MDIAFKRFGGDLETLTMTDLLNYNLGDPPLMETILVPRNGCTVIRFKANNPGT